MAVVDHRPGWLLTEAASAGRENLDAAHVASYDDKADAGAAAEVTLLMELGLDARSHVIDLGAGTGQFALAVAPSCARVVAVDVSPVMLERLRSKVTASAASNVEVVQAGFLTYEHRGPAADFVYSRWALHHLPDFWKVLALDRMHKLLRPGGILRLSDVVYSFDASDAEERIDRWCATLPTEASDGGWVRADLEGHVRDEHSTFTWLLEPMIQRSGFQIERTTYTAASSPSTSYEPSESPLAPGLRLPGRRCRNGLELPRPPGATNGALAWAAGAAGAACRSLSSSPAAQQRS